MIESYFGTKPSSELTFERYTTAVLKATLVPPSPPEDSYRKVLEAHVGGYIMINMVVLIIIAIINNIVFFYCYIGDAAHVGKLVRGVQEDGVRNAQLRRVLPLHHPRARAQGPQYWVPPRQTWGQGRHRNVACYPLDVRVDPGLFCHCYRAS